MIDTSIVRPHQYGATTEETSKSMSPSIANKASPPHRFSYDKLAENFLAALRLVVVRIWLRGL
jgi:hypothetical protein